MGARQEPMRYYRPLQSLVDLPPDTKLSSNYGKYGRPWYLRNKQVTIDRAKVWKAQHPEADVASRLKRRPKKQVYDHARYALNTVEFKKRAKEWKRIHPERAKELSRVYQWNRQGIDPFIASDVWNSATVCAICGISVVGSNKHLDHDHKTGEIRGVLCTKCNVGLGSFNDNPVALKAAIVYLGGDRG